MSITPIASTSIEATPPPVDSAAEQPTVRHLDRSLGLWAVVAVSISAMLGSGIFVLPGLAAAKTGPSVWLAYLLAGICVLPAALCKAELATAMPASGGSYVYLDRIFGPMFGTIAGVALWASMLLKSAFALLGFGAYLRVFVDLPAGPRGFETLKSYALALLVVVVLLNMLGVKKVGKAQIFVVGVALLGMAGLVVAGMGSFDSGRLAPAFSDGPTGLLAAAGFVFISYDGVTKVAAIAEEVHSPERNLPLGILVSLGIVLMIYTMVTLMLVGNIPVDQLSTDLKPIHTVAAKLGGPALGVAAAVLGVVTMTSMANAGILAASRFPYAMSRDRLLPGLLKHVHVRFKTPVVAILATGVVMALTIKLIDLERVAKLASAVVIMIFAAESIAVIMFRESRVRWYKPKFSSPWYPWLQVSGIVACGVLLWMLGPLVLVAAAGVTIPGLVIFLIYGRSRADRTGVVAKIAPRGDLRPAAKRSREATAQPVEDDAAVVVALFGSERSPEMLLDVGAALADGRKVHGVYLTEVEEQTELSIIMDDNVEVQSLSRRVDAMAEEQGLSIGLRAIVSRDLVRAVHGITSRVRCEWLVMQWTERSGSLLTALSPLGWLANHLETNLALFKDMGVRYVRRILVSPVSGPNDSLVTATADDLASKWGAKLTMVGFVPDGAPQPILDSQRDYLEQLRHFCEAETDVLVLRGASKEDAMAKASAAYDLLVMEAPNVSLRTVLRASVPERIVMRAGCSVLTVKTPPGRTHEAVSGGKRRCAGPHQLLDSMDPRGVAARLRVKHKDALFIAIARAFAEVIDGVSARQILAALRERERSQNTAIGEGMALPHATLPEGCKSYVGVFTTQRPIDYQGPDGELVDVCFVTLGPPSARHTHLVHLASIARLAQRTKLLERVRRAADAEAILEAIGRSSADLEERTKNENRRRKRQRTAKMEGPVMEQIEQRTSVSRKVAASRGQTPAGGPVRLAAHVARDGIWISQATTKRALFEDLAAATAARLDVPKEVIVVSLEQREAQGNTALGGGLAVTSTLVEGIADTHCLLASIPRGAELGAPDGLPVRLVFLVLGPPSAAGKQLKLLARIARLCRRAGLTEDLLKAATAEAIYRTIIAADQSLS